MLGKILIIGVLLCAAPYIWFASYAMFSVLGPRAAAILLTSLAYALICHYKIFPILRYRHQWTYEKIYALIILGGALVIPIIQSLVMKIVHKIQE